MERSHGGPGSADVSVASDLCTDLRLHSQLYASRKLWRQQYTGSGRASVHYPEAASARGIRHGDVVRVFKRPWSGVGRGSSFYRDAPGVARIHEGAWYDPDKGGEPGALCNTQTERVDHRHRYFAAGAGDQCAHYAGGN
ncbi:molybdopterin dinucleotide binding domain-containing protein [Escherichia coli]